MAELPRPLVGRILLQARLMELADQAAVVALLQPKQRVGPASSYERTEPYTFLCFYGTASGNICKLARWASGSWGPAVSLPLPKGVDAIAVVRDLAALPALRLRNSSPADVLFGLTSAKAATAVLSKTEWPRGLEEELCSRMTFAESATNVSWPGKLENYLRPYAKLVLA